ncbi:MAG: ABC transporter ATP-binding protein [Chloroflexi bacterium]|nr:ABC transporter ATP-binding protein [Chloroflexota bacterium]
MTKRFPVSKGFFTRSQSYIHAVDGISFDLGVSDSLGLVGESGCGKTVMALSILGLIPSPPGEIVAGSSIRFNGEELLEVKPARLREIRGNEISMIFQEPMTSLNPVLTIGRQLTEALELHLKLDGAAAVRRAIGLLEMVGIPEAAARINDYPHQFSGGMRQRVSIARAFAIEPRLLYADEAFTALDELTAARVRKDLLGLIRETGITTLFITHSVPEAVDIAQRILIFGRPGRVIREIDRDKELENGKSIAAIEIMVRDGLQTAREAMIAEGTAEDMTAEDVQKIKAERGI